LNEELGFQTRRVFDIVSRRIRSNELPPGSQFPNITALAREYGVSPVTVRTAMDHLEEAGVITRRRGVGTFVAELPQPTVVLVVDDEPGPRRLLAEQVRAEGLRAIEADGPSEAMAVLEQGRLPDMVLTDVRMPKKEDGVGFVLAIRRRWPALPVAVVSGYADDLADVRELPEWPLVEFAKPVPQARLGRVLRRVARPEVSASSRVRRPVLVAIEDPIVRSLLSGLIGERGYDVVERSTLNEAESVVGSRAFGHLFVDPDDPSSGLHRIRDFATAHPGVAVILCPSAAPLVLGEDAMAGAVITTLIPPPSASAVAEALLIRRLAS
jgi:DNA-binding NtrC family response regulator